jgi:hypothetical protein
MIDQDSDEGLREALTSAVKRYAARVESGALAEPVVEKNAITATEAVLTICELMRAADLNPFDVAMWYRRPMPEIR